MLNTWSIIGAIISSIKFPLGQWACIKIRIKKKKMLAYQGVKSGGLLEPE